MTSSIWIFSIKLELETNKWLIGCYSNLGKCHMHWLQYPIVTSLVLETTSWALATGWYSSIIECWGYLFSWAQLEHDPTCLHMHTYCLNWSGLRIWVGNQSDNKEYRLRHGSWTFSPLWPSMVTFHWLLILRCLDLKYANASVLPVNTIVPTATLVSESACYHRTQCKLHVEQLENFSSVTGQILRM